MKITLDNNEIEVKDGISLLQLIIEKSSFGEEAVICYVNGITYRSIDDNVHNLELKEGDNVAIFPLVIGG